VLLVLSTNTIAISNVVSANIQQQTWPVAVVVVVVVMLTISSPRSFESTFQIIAEHNFSLARRSQ
jgi:hypothetical protein